MVFIRNSLFPHVRRATLSYPISLICGCSPDLRGDRHSVRVAAEAVEPGAAEPVLLVADVAGVRGDGDRAAAGLALLQIPGGQLDLPDAVLGELK